MWKLLWDFIDVSVKLIFLILAGVMVQQGDYTEATFYLVAFLVMHKIDDLSSRAQSLGEE